jgi:hypothetical protein
MMVTHLGECRQMRAVRSNDLQPTRLVYAGRRGLSYLFCPSASSALPTGREAPRSAPISSDINTRGSAWKDVGGRLGRA